MHKSLRKAALAFALAVGTGLAGSASAQPVAPPTPAPQACQRDCLEGFVNKYLAAMAAHKVDPALFAPNVRFTENGIQLPFGTEGLWATASGVGQYKLYVPDIETQNVAFLGTVLEQASSSATGPQRPPELVGLSLRLRIADGKIAEVEQIAARPERPLGPNAGNVSSSPFPATGEAVEKMGAPNARFLTAIPEKDRHSRADLVRIGNYYFDAVERNTGHDYYPFSDDCLRHENGIVTAGPPTPEFPQRKACKQQLQTSLIGAVTSIRDRRFVAIDRERGIAFAFAFFDHRPIDWTWQLGELFKIDGENITQVEAIFIRGPYGVCSGWSTYEQCRSEQPRDER
ncbi:MAG: hypothetical protein P0Y56_05485 [Candidatus Andeanibacterium colombiense]|uniref:DUF8021 domain-containing protein n=1 Tax=Candidatus Andeanibacterium colombiense TaxID=3121345 RepID=A0AAJ5X8K5_9SPHN|nr:MAG: hypothetical protein P0Y56_05485 [Sphingomonadaceae bacterium]